jgi:hypothetical protein
MRSASYCPGKTFTSATNGFATAIFFGACSNGSHSGKLGAEGLAVDASLMGLGAGAVARLRASHSISWRISRYTRQQLAGDLPPAGAMAASGTTRTCRDAYRVVAIGGKADLRARSLARFMSAHPGSRSRPC